MISNLRVIIAWVISVKIFELLAVTSSSCNEMSFIKHLFSNFGTEMWKLDNS